MSISFSGIGSGLPVSDWIEAMMQAEQYRLTRYQENKYEAQNARTALSSIESKVTSLRSALEKLTDANIAKTLDIFAKRTVSSSDEDIATATASTNSSTQKIELEIDRLATSTTAKSLTEIGEYINGSEKFSSLTSNSVDDEGTYGTFSFYADGVKHDFTIQEDDTLNDIVNDINNAGITGLEASIEDGKFKLKTDDASISNLTLGSNADTSDFLNVMRLSTADAQSITDPTYEQVYESTSTISKVDIEGKIIDGSANLSGTFSGTYTFKIGGAEFTVDENTTLQGLISKINNEDDAGVLINYDSRENKFNLTSTESGETAINLEDTSGDFLKQIGLIDSGGNSLASQTLGENALIRVNGSTDAIEVNSNTVTGDMSGIEGVTISLNSVTEAGEKITLDVAQDTEQLTSAVKDFVEKFNAVISEIDRETSTGQDLKGEYSLVSMRNSLRTMVTDMVSGLSEYNSFGMIGISTGDVGTSVEEDTNALEFDESEFLKAIEGNPGEVKALLVGDSDLGITGILQQLEEKAENVLDPINGYFATKEDSYNTTVANLDESIEKEETRLEDIRERLTLQFSQMDQYIAQMQQQQSALSLL